MDAPSGGASPANGNEDRMLWTLALILLILWALGMLTGYTLGGFVHLLIVIAIVVLLFRLISRRRIV